MSGRGRLVGVTVGKFNPPHLGHLHLVETGASQVDRLYVLLAGRADQTIPAERRASWLADAAPPNVEVLVTPDDLPVASAPWAARALDVLPEPPDVAFTSEPWGPEWAGAMGAHHVSVDASRSRHRTSGTRLRADLRREFRWLVPAARAALARRVVLVGAESSGKTTLAEALANRLQTVWVPEYGRVYWEGRRWASDQSWTTDELRRIARGQQLMENDLARRADNGVVVADTNALVTAVWHHRYHGHWDAELLQLAESIKPDLYLVCAPDFEWVQDGTRESKAHRQRMHDMTLERVRESTVPHEVLTGPPDGRLTLASERVDELCRFEPLV